MYESVIDYIVSYVPNLAFAVLFVVYVGRQNADTVQTLRENNRQLMDTLMKICSKCVDES